ncbi:MAG: hypothetical protein HC788_13510 [Sphingopyxis sp.]|nr:hypothetical protein [Sphingopyxis sp.]
MRDLFGSASAEAPMLALLPLLPGQVPLDDVPEDAQRLLQLVYSTIMVAMCIEIWHQPNVANGEQAACSAGKANRGKNGAARQHGGIRNGRRGCDRPVCRYSAIRPLVSALHALLCDAGRYDGN